MLTYKHLGTKDFLATQNIRNLQVNNNTAILNIPQNKTSTNLNNDFAINYCGNILPDMIPSE